MKQMLEPNLQPDGFYIAFHPQRLPNHNQIVAYSSVIQVTNERYKIAFRTYNMDKSFSNLGKVFQTIGRVLRDYNLEQDLNQSGQHLTPVTIMGWWVQVYQIKNGEFHKLLVMKLPEKGTK